jgi:hypothetical protein
MRVVRSSLRDGHTDADALILAVVNPVKFAHTDQHPDTDQHTDADADQHPSSASRKRLL